MNPDNAFGSRVRQRRRALDLTQDELARRVGCAAITLRKIEAGDARPSQQIAERLAMALAIPLDERADFVRQARSVLPGDRAPDSPRTPQVAPEEIGLEDLSGRAIRSYLLHDKIGVGSFGVVYRAVQPLVEREVALKIILPHYANHPDFIRRFESEAQLVARLEHPHIVPLYDYWREPGVAYLVMRLLRGGSVNDLLQQGPLPLETTAQIMEQVGAALHAAHRAGVIHRDLKPSNVLLDEDGNAYLADFGIARHLGDPATHTQAGPVSGTPAYLSPEQIKADPIRPQTDIYSFGVMLYELLTGTRPFLGPTPIDLVQQHLYAPLPPLAANRSGLPEAFDQIIAHATAKDPHDRYADVDQLLVDFHDVQQTGHLRAAPPAPLSPIEIINPYKGLRAFEEADAPDFFGREALTQQLLARLGEGGDLNRFLAVIGPSGSGKSSVVKAGLVPALRRGALPGSENWFLIELTPGPHPLEELETALSRIAANPLDSLWTQLREDRRGFLRAINCTLPVDQGAELVLIIDQFEEVFTLVADEAERVQLLDGLVEAIMAEPGRVWVIITLRADFIDRPLRYVDFGELVQRRSELVLPLTPDELERAIVGPADRVGLRLEAGLPEAISADVIEQPGALPLLQYALTELYEMRSDHTLTKAAYQSIGGVRGALGRRAEEVFTALGPAGQLAAQQMFLRLVTLGEGTEDVRRRVQRVEVESLTPAPLSQSGRGDGGEGGITSVVDAFGKARLLTFDRDLQTRGPTLEVAHEALLREWPRLREWLAENRADIRLQRQLAVETAGWLESDRDASFLLRGSRLHFFEEWSQSMTIALTVDERSYLQASIEERQRQQIAEAARQAHEAKLERRARRVLQGLVGVALIAAIISGGLAIVASLQRNRAEAAEAEALHQREAALQQASVGLAAQALTELSGSSPERSVLLALEALENYPHTAKAESALAQAVEDYHPYYFLTSDYELSRPPEAQWSPDGNYIAVGEEGLILMWDVQAHQSLWEIPLPDMQCPAADVAWSPANDRVAAVQRSYVIGWGVCPESSIGVWSIAAGTQLITTTSPVTEATSIDWSPDGARLVVGFGDGSIKLLQADTLETLASWTGHSGAISKVVWSPSGRQFVTASWDKTAKIWDATTGTLVQTLIGHAAEVNGAAWSPSGDRVATASLDGTGRVWDALTGEVLFALAGHTGPVRDIAWSANGLELATISGDGTARLWLASTGASLLQLRGAGGDLSTVAWAPSSDQIVMTGGLQAQVWNVTLRIPRLIGHADWVLDAQWSPDGSRIATTSFDNTARVWDANSGREILKIEHDSWLRYFSWSPDGRNIATTGGTTDMIIWDVINGTATLKVDMPEGGLPTSAVYSPDGSRLLVPTDYIVTVLDATSGKVIGHTPPQTCRVPFYPTWSPDGMRFVIGCQYTNIEGDNTPASIWNADTLELIATLESEDGETIKGVWSPDGRSIAVSYQQGAVKVWDAASGAVRATFATHTTQVWDTVWSPDSQRIASADESGAVYVWEAATGQVVMNFDTPAVVLSLDWSPDGKYVIAAGGFNTPVVKRVWQSTQELIDYAKDCCVARELTAEERQQFGLAAK